MVLRIFVCPDRGLGPSASSVFVGLWIVEAEVAEFFPAASLWILLFLFRPEARLDGAFGGVVIHSVFGAGA